MIYPVKTPVSLLVVRQEGLAGRVYHDDDGLLRCLMKRKETILEMLVYSPFNCLLQTLA